MGAVDLQKQIVTISFETWLVLGIIGFYLFDSAMLLFFNELVFIEKKGKWIFACPESRWQLMEKIPYLPNPLTPGNALFRLSWSLSKTDKQQESQEALQSFLNAFNPLRLMTSVLFTLLMIGIPVVLFIFGTGLGFLLLIGLIYFTIVIMLTLIYRQKETFGVSGNVIAKLAFDSLACPPFALNLIRKITLRYPFAGDPICFYRQVSDPNRFAQLIHSLCQRIDEMIDFEDETSPRYSALQSYKKSLTGMVS
ncbi:hypothetical protein [Sulfurirhabdus autotrophica]|uniref:Uncharacterized protein n=1 Tax=Sulfurirhabdus autotrophica TaxID=1706046 RepID=A0A4R3XYV0_9PROT|nr:hypothetical protein [Sulfurirhabdus autotrophica]TCV84081.1 hypothetical protein EDC63_11316 [Sulfurirhabdus autotrophica]